MGKTRRRKHALCRRAGYCLYGSLKCPVVKKPYPPGEHKKDAGRRFSDYGRQLFEKQKLKNTYGMREKQFLRFFKMALRKKGTTGDNLLILLESRLDNIVYRLNFARTIFDARQLVSHKHIIVNGKKVNIPSYLVKLEAKVSLTEKAKKFVRVQNVIKENKDKPVMPYLKIEKDKLSAVFTGIENVSDILHKVEISQIVEFYSRKT